MRNSRVPAGQSISLLVTAIVGLAIAILSGLALVPRVRLVEVLTVLASAVGSGAAFAVTVVQFTRARAANRQISISRTPVLPLDSPATPDNRTSSRTERR
jgi:hypothetical protein